MRDLSCPLFSLALLCLLVLTGCGGDSGTGPVDVKWDRTACERCRMVLSDRQHSAQIRISEPDDRSRVYLFDDIGCALIWLQDTPYEKDPSTEVWVTDWQSGAWIDATTATYLKGQVTPMEYGLGAQQAPAHGGLDFGQARAHILDVEQRFNVHGGHLDVPPPSK